MDIPVIRQLPDHIANQIAAGEVIERPAAVVKELIENALDAGASSIAVRIEEGGQRLVEVSDDGHGMRPDGLIAALGRHATSKLVDADDLFRVATLGFRGEALPSIAAVSEFELASRPRAAEGGNVLQVISGEQRPLKALAMQPGTRVTVRNLFWNVPVRLKFLKTSATETGHVTDTLTRLALGHPDIAFRLENDGRTVLDLPAVDELTPRIRSCFGKQLATGLLAVDGNADSMQLTGLIAHPSAAKPTAKRQFVWLNGRHIRDRLVIAALREGYRGFCEPRLHPVVFLNLDLDPALVDVNVHPTKAEVRFRRDKEVFHLIRSALRRCLEEHVGGFQLLEQPAAVKRTVVKAANPPREPAVQERFLPHTPQVHASEPGSQATDTPASTPTAETRPPAPPLTSRTAPAPAAVSQASTPGVSEPATVYHGHLPHVRKVVQLNDMYVLVETDDGIRVIDQHALHEKALWLTLDPTLTDFEAGGKQELLVPKNIELGAAEVRTVEPLLAKLAEHGIEAEVFGPTTILLRSFPSMLAKTNWQVFFNDLAAQGPGDDGKDPLAKLREAIGHRRACRAAIKAGHRLSEAEMLELVHLLETMEGLEHCPHGRPTTLDLSWLDLEKRFQR